MEFYTAYNPAPTKANWPGNRYEPEYIQRYDENGVGYLEKTGERDVYAEIQSHAEEANIQNLIARYAAGDANIIARMSNLTYDPEGNIVNAPKTITEYMNMTEDLKRDFAKLPKEIREKFNNDFNQYAAQAGTKEWYAAFKTKEKTTEVKENGEQKQ